MKNWLRGNDEAEDDRLENRDPEMDGELQITKVPFAQLVKAFPNTQQVRQVKIS
jgi:hypothetical protein